jgi:hypothetical protein
MNQLIFTADATQSVTKLPCYTYKRTLLVAAVVLAAMVAASLPMDGNNTAHAQG